MNKVELNQKFLKRLIKIKKTKSLKLMIIEGDIK